MFNFFFMSILLLFGQIPFYSHSYIMHFISLPSVSAVQRFLTLTIIRTHSFVASNRFSLSRVLHTESIKKLSMYIFMRKKRMKRENLKGTKLVDGIDWKNHMIFKTRDYYHYYHLFSFKTTSIHWKMRFLIQWKTIFSLTRQRLISSASLKCILQFLHVNFFNFYFIFLPLFHFY